MVSSKLSQWRFSAAKSSSSSPDSVGFPTRSGPQIKITALSAAPLSVLANRKFFWLITTGFLLRSARLISSLPSHKWLDNCRSLLFQIGKCFAQVRLCRCCPSILFSHATKAFRTGIACSSRCICRFSGERTLKCASPNSNGF